MHAIETADGRVPAHRGNPTDEELATLHKTMFAYASTYTVEEGQEYTMSIFRGIKSGTVRIKFDPLTPRIAWGRAASDAGL